MWLRRSRKGARVIVGRDPRFLGETFCSMAAEILSAQGITPLVVADAAPTPAFAHAVIANKADGVINFTASHNPPEYNGIKFSTPDGCPALPEVTKKIEAEIVAGDTAAVGQMAAYRVRCAGSLDPKPAYLKRLGEIVDLEVIRKAGLAGCVRSHVGSGARLLRRTAAKRWSPGRDGARLSRCAFRRTRARTGRSSARRPAEEDA